MIMISCNCDWNDRSGGDNYLKDDYVCDSKGYDSGKLLGVK